MKILNILWKSLITHLRFKKKLKLTSDLTGYEFYRYTKDGRDYVGDFWFDICILVTMKDCLADGEHDGFLIRKSA
jgi:hypothetical protein